VPASWTQVAAHEDFQMDRWQGLNKLLYKLLRKKPVPLRQGKNGPFIFIHINKTAGTSIGRAIGLPVKHHLMATEVIERIGTDVWNEAFKFTVVREAVGLDAELPHLNASKRAGYDA